MLEKLKDFSENLISFIPDPLSTTRAATSSSHMLVPMNTQKGLTVGRIDNIHNVYYDYFHLHTKTIGCWFVCLYSFHFKTSVLIGLRVASLTTAMVRE